MDFLVLRVPLPADLLARSNLIVNITPHIKKIGQTAEVEVISKIERERRRRTAEERAAAEKVPGQTDFEEAIAEAEARTPA